MFHVIANMECRFQSVQEAIDFYSDYTFVPSVPKTHSPDEDLVTPRICVAPTVEDCMTGIGLLGRLRRCLSANDGAKSYSTQGFEIYPIIIVEFDSNEEYYKPSLQQVPDREDTNEYWLMCECKPISLHLVWLDMYSIAWYSEIDLRAKSVDYYEDVPEWGNHPWLNGKGHALDSSEMED